MPGIRVEKLTASIVISRFMRRATSVKRSIWNPSTPPPSLGIACGAKVPSTPVLSGGSLSWAGPALAQESCHPDGGKATLHHREPPRAMVMFLRVWPPYVAVAGVDEGLRKYARFRP